MTAMKSPAQTNGTRPEPSPALATGYRLTLVPGGLEVSARLSSVEEINDMVRLLQAGTVFLETTTDGDMDAPLNLSQRLEAKANGAAAHPKQ